MSVVAVVDPRVAGTNPELPLLLPAPAVLVVGRAAGLRTASAYVLALGALASVLLAFGALVPVSVLLLMMAPLIVALGLALVLPSVMVLPRTMLTAALSSVPVLPTVVLAALARVPLLFWPYLNSVLVWAASLSVVGAVFPLVTELVCLLLTRVEEVFLGCLSLVVGVLSVPILEVLADTAP